MRIIITTTGPKKFEVVEERARKLLEDIKVNPQLFGLELIEIVEGLTEYSYTFEAFLLPKEELTSVLRAAYV